MINKLSRIRASSMIRKSTIKFSILLLTACLISCDGGILGTGDGDIIVPEETASNPSTESPDADNGTSPEPDPAAPSTGFSNSSASTQRMDALLKFVHANSSEQDGYVVTLNGATEPLLLPLPGLFFLQGSDQYRSVIPSDSHSIEIFKTEDFRDGSTVPELQLSSLNVAAGTVTTMVIRNNFSDSSKIELLPLITRPSTGEEAAIIRGIHAADAFAAKGAIDIYLISQGEDIATAQPLVPALSYNAFPASEYFSLELNQYEIIITEAGTKSILAQSPGLLDVKSIQVISLIIRDNPEQPLGQAIDILIVEDSLIDVE